jgi:hypothetical protein
VRGRQMPHMPGMTLSLIEILVAAAVIAILV